MVEAIQPSVQSARAEFFARGQIPHDRVGQPILRAWLRCADMGLDHARPPEVEPPEAANIRELCERHERLRRLCRPELDALNAEARETGGIAILTNAEGVVLDAFGDSSFAGRAAEVALLPGIAWNETAMGANAIGAALAERRAVAVHGGEHYYDAHGILSCAAAPILDPRGAVVGVLDLSAHADMQRLHALGLVRLAVEQIEHRFFAGGIEGASVLRFHTEAALVGAAREGVLVFDEDHRLIGANRRGLSMLRQDWSALDVTTFADLFETAPDLGGDLKEWRAHDGGRFHGVMRPPASAPSAPAAAPAARTLEDAELAMMRAALEACGGNVSAAARQLGVHRSTLYRRVFGPDQAN